jgi:low affinity Fe/Cu permease
MPSLLQNRTEDILSQSNTSRDSSDLNKKLNFTLMDDKNLTNNEFIGIETCYDSDLQGGNSTLKNNVSFDKEKNMPKSR